MSSVERNESGYVVKLTEEEAQEWMRRRPPDPFPADTAWQRLLLVQRPPGVDRVVVEWTPTPCAACRGSGDIYTYAGYEPVPCGPCDGSGWGPEGVQLRTLERTNPNEMNMRFDFTAVGAGSTIVEAEPRYRLVDLDRPVLEEPT